MLKSWFVLDVRLPGEPKYFRYKATGKAEERKGPGIEAARKPKMLIEDRGFFYFPLPFSFFSSSRRCFIFLSMWLFNLSVPSPGRISTLVSPSLVSVFFLG